MSPTRSGTKRFGDETTDSQRNESEEAMVTCCINARGRNLLVIFSTLVLPALTGCAKDDPYDRVGVSGEVTFRGQPVVEGNIRFEPLPGTMTPMLMTDIEDGHYSADESGGVPVGRYRVEIRAYDPNESRPQYPGPLDPPRTQLLPPKYNSQSQLELTVEGDRGDIVQDYELTP